MGKRRERMNLFLCQSDLMQNILSRSHKKSTCWINREQCSKFSRANGCGQWLILYGFLVDKILVVRARERRSIIIKKNTMQAFFLEVQNKTGRKKKNSFLPLSALLSTNQIDSRRQWMENFFFLGSLTFQKHFQI